MSLINDALRRAECEKARSAAAGGAPVRLAPRPPAHPRRLSRPAKAALAIFFVAGAWLVSPLVKTPGQSDATAPEPVAQALPSHNAPAASAAEHSMSAEALAAQQKTLAALRSYQPPATPKPSRAVARTTLAAAAAPQTDGSVSAPPVVKTAAPQAPAAPTAVAVTTPTPAAPLPSHSIPAVAAVIHAATAPAVFKLSGVMYGPAGPAAIINGHALQAGDRIDGATVVRIDEQSVLLNIDGRTVVVRL